MSEERFRRTYDEMKKQGHFKKTTYDKYRQRTNARDEHRRKKEYEDRKIDLS